MIHLTPPAQNAHKCQRGDQYWEKQQASKFQLEDVPRGPCRKEAIYGQERVCNACCHGLDGEHATERFCPGNVHFGCQRGHLQIGQCYFLDTVRHAECTRAEHCHLDQGQRHRSAKDSSKAQLPYGGGNIAHVARSRMPRTIRACTARTAYWNWQIQRLLHVSAWCGPVPGIAQQTRCSLPPCTLQDSTLVKLSSVAPIPKLCLHKPRDGPLHKRPRARRTIHRRGSIGGYKYFDRVSK